MPITVVINPIPGSGWPAGFGGTRQDERLAGGGIARAIRQAGLLTSGARTLEAGVAADHGTDGASTAVVDGVIAIVIQAVATDFVGRLVVLDAVAIALAINGASMETVGANAELAGGAVCGGAWSTDTAVVGRAVAIIVQAIATDLRAGLHTLQAGRPGGTVAMNLAGHGASGADALLTSGTRLGLTNRA